MVHAPHYAAVAFSFQLLLHLLLLPLLLLILVLTLDAIHKLHGKNSSGRQVPLDTGDNNTFIIFKQTGDTLCIGCFL